MATYTYPTFPYQAPHDLMSGAPQRKPLVIIGAGPVGLAAAQDAHFRHFHAKKKKRARLQR